MRYLKTLSGRHLCCGLIAAVFGLLVWSAMGPAAASGQGVGLVRAIEGEAVAVRGGARDSLVVGATVMADDVIETGDGSKLRIVFHDGSVLMAGANTRVSIDEYDPHGAESGVLDLLAGVIRTRLSDFWASGFAVETRAAIASVRSTDWVTIAESDRGSVFVLAGEVGVMTIATGEQTELGPGFGIDVEVGGGLPEAREWPDERVERTLGRLPPP